MQLKSRPKVENSCYYTAQSLFSRFPSKDLKTKTYKTIILPAMVCSCETWTLEVREEKRLKLFESRILRGILLYLLYN